MKCTQQVSAHGENTQPHPKRVADVTTKLLFACYTNHYATSEAKAPLAAVAVRSKPHRTRVRQLLPAMVCEGTRGPGMSGQGNEQDLGPVSAPATWQGWGRAAEHSAGRTLPRQPGARASRDAEGSTPAICPCFGQQGQRRKSYCQLGIESGCFKHHSLVTPPKKGTSF